MNPRSHHRFLIAAVLVLGLLAVVPMGTSPSTAAEGDAGFRVVGKLPVAFDATHNAEDRRKTGWLILDPTNRRGYQVLVGPVLTTTTAGLHSFPPSTILQSFDLDTLELGRRRRIDGLVPLQGRVQPDHGSGVHAVDEQGGRIFLAMSDSTQLPLQTTSIPADGQWSFSTVVVIDQHLFDSDAPDSEVFANRLTHPTPEHQVLAQNHGLKGMRYVGPPGQGKLLMLWADWVPAPALPRVHQLMQWGVDRPTVDSWTARDLLVLPCGRAMLNGAIEPRRAMYPLDILPGPGYLAFACQKTEGSTQVVKVHLDAAGRPDPNKMELHSLGRKYSDTIADVRGERLLLRSQYAGNSWWVFDARRSTWAGSVGVVISDNGLVNAAGLDPVSGRLYTLAPHYYYDFSGKQWPGFGGLGFADARLTPAPQLQIPLPELAYPGLRRIEVDPQAPNKTRRLFVRRGSADSRCFDPVELRDFSCPVEDHWLVIEDRVPVAQQPPGNEVDRLTIDVDEQAGVTAANFDRAAAGFGARVLLVSGVSGATTRQADEGQSTPVAHRSGCLPADRELVLGQVSTARVGNVAASAQATSLYADPTTALDAADPVHRCWPAPRLGTLPEPSVPPPDAETPGLTANSVSASCTGEQRNRARPLAGPPAHEAEAGCGHAGGTFDASATLRGTTIGALTVGEAGSRVWVEQDAQRGRVTRVESVARDVVLGDLGTVGLVRVTAAAWTGGRPGTAGTSFKREICGVSTGPVQERGCLDEKQKADLARDVTSRSGGLVELRLRTPDEMLARGSAGGYQAGVQRASGDRFVDTTIARDHSKAVPGLEVTVYRDDGSYGANREIVQLAGVETSSQYGIYCLFGPAPSGKACNTSALGPVDVEGEPTSGAEAFSSGYLADADDRVSPSFESAAPIAASDEDEEGGNPVARLLRRLAQVPADMLRLIASGPAELVLTAGMWLLLWLPCCIFERRRAARRALLRFSVQ